MPYVDRPLACSILRISSALSKAGLPPGAGANPGCGDPGYSSMRVFGLAIASAKPARKADRLYVKYMQVNLSMLRLIQLFDGEREFRCLGHRYLTFGLRDVMPSSLAWN